MRVKPLWQYRPQNRPLEERLAKCMKTNSFKFISMLLRKQGAGLFLSNSLLGLLACNQTLCLQGLKREVDGELRAINQVAAPESAGLLEKAEQPFEPVLAHPLWGLVLASREDVECLPHASHHRDVQFLAVFVHPAFLFWCAQTNPKHVGRGAGNQGHNLFVFFGIQRPKGWRKGAANFGSREAALEEFRHARGHPRLATVKEMPVATPGRLLAELQQEVGAVDSARQMKPSAPPQPNQGHSVGYDRVRRVQDFLKRRIMLSLDNSVHACRCDSMAAAVIVNPFLHPGHQILCLYRVDLHSKHIKRNAIGHDTNGRLLL